LSGEDKYECNSLYYSSYYINYFLWIIAILVLSIYLSGNFKNKFSIKYYSLFSSLLFIYIIGIAIAYLEGIIFNNHIKFMYRDLSVSMIIPLNFAFAGLVSRIRNIRYFENIISILATYLCSNLVYG